MMPMKTRSREAAPQAPSTPPTTKSPQRALKDKMKAPVVHLSTGVQTGQPSLEATPTSSSIAEVATFRPTCSPHMTKLSRCWRRREPVLASRSSCTRPMETAMKSTTALPREGHQSVSSTSSLHTVYLTTVISLRDRASSRVLHIDAWTTLLSRKLTT